MKEFLSNFIFIKCCLLMDCEENLNNPEVFYYILIPIVIAIIVVIICIVLLVCCYYKKGRQNGNQIPKRTRDVERCSGVFSGIASRSGSQDGPQRDPRETDHMLESRSHGASLYPTVVSKTTPSKYSRDESQTEQLLKNTDDLSPVASIPFRERGETFESAVSASPKGRSSTQFATPFPYNEESGTVTGTPPRRNTTGATTEQNIYPMLPRTNTVPSPKPQPIDTSTVSTDMDQSFLQDMITTNSPLMDHSMAPSQVPTVIQDGDNVMFTEKQNIEHLRTICEILVTNSVDSQTSINSNSSHKRRSQADTPGDDVCENKDFKKPHLQSPSKDLTLEESLDCVRQTNDSINSANPCELLNQINTVGSSEGSNLSNKSSMPSEGESSSNYPNHENERTPVRHKLQFDSMNDPDSDTSICLPIVSNQVKDRYATGPRDINTPSLDSVSISSSVTTDLITRNSLPSPPHTSIREDSLPTNIPKPDLITTSPLKPDVIPGPTLDGPPTKLDFFVNSITGTIYETHEGMVKSYAEETSDASMAPCEHIHDDSTMTEPHVDNGVTDSVHSDPPVSYPGQLEDNQTSEPETASNSELDMTKGLSLGQGPINIREDANMLVPDSLPSPTHTTNTEYLTANNTLSDKTDSLSVSTDDNECIDTSFPLSLYNPVFDTQHDIAEESNLQNSIASQKQEAQIQEQPEPQQELQSSQYSESTHTSLDCVSEHLRLQSSDSFVILPNHDLGLDIDVTNIGCNPQFPQTCNPTISLPVQMDHDTIVIDANDLSITPDDNSNNCNTPVALDEVAYEPQGNDAIPLNEDSIIPSSNLKQNESDFAPTTDLCQNNIPLTNTPPVAPSAIDTTESHLHQRSVDSPVTFSNYIAKEWIGTSDNAKRVRNGYHELEKMGYTHLMSIRGDNYCAVRSTLFQTFCVRDFSVCSFLANMKPPVQAKQIVSPMMEKYPFLNKWSFANKPSFHELGDTKEVLELCIANLALEVDHVRAWKPVDRMVYIYGKLNMQKEMFDFSLMEAVKFYMFMQLAEYWEIYSKGGDIPEPMFFIFIREDSTNLEDFLVNHLNHVGDSGGLEMVEMFLLGFTLDLQIKVARISSFGKEDFLTYYPQGDYPPERIISISAEDDRHYNALATLESTEDFFLPENKIPKSN